MRGYSQFSFWISIAPDMIYLSHIVIIWEKILPITGLEIATDTVTNATNIFSLATKNSALVST